VYYQGVSSGAKQPIRVTSTGTGILSRFRRKPATVTNPGPVVMNPGSVDRNPGPVVMNPAFKPSTDGSGPLPPKQAAASVNAAKAAIARGG